MGKHQVGNQSRKPKKNLPNFFINRINEGLFILLTAGVLFVLLSLSTYELTDPSWSHVSKVNTEVANAGGQVGAYLADALYLLFGYFAFLLPLCVAYLSWFILKDHRVLQLTNKLAMFLRGSGLIFLMIGGCGLLSLESQIKPIDSFHSAGGLLGSFVSGGFEYAMNLSGASLLLLAIFLVGVTLLTGLSWVLATEKLGSFALVILNWTLSILIASSRVFRAKFKSFKGKETSVAANKSEPKLFSAQKDKPETKLMTNLGSESISLSATASPSISPLTAAKPAKEIARESSKELPKETKSIKGQSLVSAGLPSLSLLDKGKPGKAMGGYTHQELENLSREVEQHLLDFGIQADVVAVHPGL